MRAHRAGRALHRYGIGFFDELARHSSICSTICDADNCRHWSARCKQVDQTGTSAVLSAIGNSVRCDAILSDHRSIAQAVVPLAVPTITNSLCSLSEKFLWPHAD